MDDEIYERWLDELDVRDVDGVTDEYAADLLYFGWFADDDEFHGNVDRIEARLEFYEYMGLTEDDIDWEEWREMMGYGEN